MKYCRTKEKHTWSRHDQTQAHHAIMQQWNVSHSTVGIVASGYAQPGRRDSILKCTASHCQRTTQTLLRFQKANMKNH